MPRYAIITQDDIKEAHFKHQLWLRGTGDGEQAVFNNCSIENVNMNGCTFSGASFYGTLIENCSIIGASFQNAIFESTKFNNIAAYGTSFNSCNFSSASFSSVNFSDSNFYNANFFNAVIKNVNISNASFHNANLIIGGYDSRGYLFYAYQRLDGGITICAGCRTFYRFDDAYSHWHTRHRGNIVLSEEIMGNLDKIKRVARAKGWIE